VTIKRLLVIAAAVIGMAAAAVLLFYAGDHDAEYQRPVPPTGGRPSPIGMHFPPLPHGARV
jgi:hypothetical protein